jgi:hypothetical protein
MFSLLQIQGKTRFFLMEGKRRIIIIGFHPGKRHGKAGTVGVHTSWGEQAVLQRLHTIIMNYGKLFNAFL